MAKPTQSETQKPVSNPFKGMMEKNKPKGPVGSIYSASALAKPVIPELNSLVHKDKLESVKESEPIPTNPDKYKSYDSILPPNHPKFCPIKDSPMTKGQPIPFLFLVKALQLIEKTEGKGSQTILVEIMSNVFRAALVHRPSELPDLFYFFIVKLAPDYEGLETGIGHEISVKAVAKACGKLPKEIRD